MDGFVEVLYGFVDTRDNFISVNGVNGLHLLVSASVYLLVM